jgi:hypothetical protein
MSFEYNPLEYSNHYEKWQKLVEKVANTGLEQLFLLEINCKASVFCLVNKFDFPELSSV